MDIKEAIVVLEKTKLLTGSFVAEALEVSIKQLKKEESAQLSYNKLKAEIAYLVNELDCAFKVDDGPRYCKAINTLRQLSAV